MVNLLCDTQSQITLHFHTATRYSLSANVLSPQLSNMAEALVKQVLIDGLHTSMEIV